MTNLNTGRTQAGGVKLPNPIKALKKAGEAISEKLKSVPNKFSNFANKVREDGFQEVAIDIVDDFVDDIKESAVSSPAVKAGAELGKKIGKKFKK